MSVNVRIAGIAASGAFVLSALVGIIFGVGFPTVLLRAAIGGVVFGAGTFGALVLVNRYVPELLALSDDEGVAENVDISVGDDEDSAKDYGKAQESDSSKRSRRGYFDESLVEEVEEVPAAPESAPEPAGSGEEAQTAESDGAAVDDEKLFESGGDALPDLQNFSGAFDSLDNASSTESDDAGTATGSGGAGQGADSAGGAATAGSGGDDDPKMMADAIRTVLKRES